MSQSQENLWTDGRMDRPYFIGPFPPRLGVQLKAYGVEGELFLLLKNYLENREQRVVVNG